MGLKKTTTTLGVVGGTPLRTGEPIKPVATFADLGMKVEMPLPEPKASAPTKKRKMVKEGVGDRGKFAEKEVTKVLEGWNRLAAFAFERLPDARAAGGRLKQQISDFMCWYTQPDGSYEWNYCIPLEVKSTEHSTKNGSYLLSAGALDQLPRLKKVEAAGANPYVLVYFKVTDRWRVAPISYFEFGQPSWNMSDLPEFTSAKAALQSTGFFPRDS